MLDERGINDDRYGKRKSDPYIAVNVKKGHIKALIFSNGFKEAVTDKHPANKKKGIHTNCPPNYDSACVVEYPLKIKII
jgi:hypothetical protein